MSVAPVIEPRPTCARCTRPLSVCYCAHLPEIATRTRVVFLQHPREADVGIGTARMAHLSLPGSELHVGVEWSGSPALASALGDPARPAALLYPGPSAVDLAQHPPPGPITLVVVDGTWAHARKIVSANPELAALPRYTFEAPRPSEYRIRREPKAEYLSTIESLAHVLGVLEGDPERFAALHAPFRAMVEKQLEHASRSTGSRHRKRARTGPRTPGLRLPSVFRERADDLVCVVAEANAWPFGSELRDKADPGDLVQCVAVRPSTGERLEMFAAPRRPLSPATSFHSEIPEETLRAAPPPAVFLERWRAFLRKTDVLVTWGTHTPRVLAAASAELPATRVDLRLVARRFTSRRVGSIETFSSERESLCRWPALDAAGGAGGIGRGGRRLSLVVDVAGHFVALAAGRGPAEKPPDAASEFGVVVVDRPAAPG